HRVRVPDSVRARRRNCAFVRCRASPTPGGPMTSTLTPRDDGSEPVSTATERITVPPNASSITDVDLSDEQVRPHWIDDWRPEDPEFWEKTGAPIARRNLIFSIVSEHIGFAIWT